MKWILLAGLIGCSPTSEDIARNLASPNPAVREDTAKIARNFGSDMVEKALIESLKDPIEKVRYHAVGSLIELEAVQAAPALIVVVQEDSSDKVRREAVDALGRLKDPAAVPVLISLLEARADRPPMNAIWALGNLEDGRALDVLAGLRDHSDPYVRWNANRSLRLLKPVPETADAAPPAGEGATPAPAAAG